MQTVDVPPFKPWKGLHSATKRLADGTVKKYYYAWKGGPRVADDGSYIDQPKARSFSGEIDRLAFITANRAKQRGQEYTLTPQWIKQALSEQGGCCAVTGIPFDLSNTKFSYSRNPRKPSIDRIDSKGGYTEENCRIVLCCVNVAINEWGLDNFLEIAQAALAHRAKRKFQPETQ